MYSIRVRHCTEYSCVCMYVHACVCMHVRVYACARARARVCVCVCVCVCACIKNVSINQETSKIKRPPKQFDHYTTLHTQGNRIPL